MKLTTRNPMGSELLSKAAVNRRTPDAPRSLSVQRVSRQRVECGASAPLSKGMVDASLSVWTRDFSVRSFSPHPGPLPWGEGTGAASSLEFCLADELSAAGSIRECCKVL